MPSASAIKAGETFVRMSLDAGDMEKTLSRVRNKLDKFARSAVAIGAVLSAVGGVGVAALTKAAAAANRVELVGRRLDAVFQGTAESAREFARALAVDIGDSRFAVEDTMVTFKSFFAEIVAGQDAQEQFSRNMTLLSRDFAAFQGMDTTEALQRFISALSGSPEVLDRFGINLKAAALDAEFAAKGLDVTTENATEFQKVIARMAIIERTMGKQGAIGKAQKELKTFSGALRAATSAVRDFSVAVGKALLPVLQPAITAFTGLVRGFEVLATHAPAVTVAFGVLVVGTAALGVSILAAAAAATALGLAIAVASTLVTAYTGYVQHAKLQGAGFAAVLQHASAQAKGFAAGVASAGASAMGFKMSTEAAAIGLASLRSALVATVSTLGTLVPMMILMGSAAGGGAKSFLAMTAALLAGAIAIRLVRAAMTRMTKAAARASEAVAFHAAVTGKAATANMHLAASLNAATLSFGRVGRVALFAGGAVKAVAVAFMSLAAPAVLAAGIIASLVGFVLVFAHQFGVLKAAGKAVVDVFYVFGAVAVASFKAIISIIPGLEGAVGGLVKFFKWAWDNAIEGIEAVKDAWADLMWLIGIGPGSSDAAIRKQTEAQIAAADEVAEHIMALDRRIEDARIASIGNRRMRDEAAANAKFDREIEDVRKTQEEEINASRNDALKQALDGNYGLHGDSLDEAVTSINAKYDQMIADIDTKNAEVLKLEEARGLALEKIAQEHAERMHDINTQLQGRLARASIAAMQDGAAKELAALRQRHEEEMMMSRLAGDQRLALRKAQQDEEANLIAKFNKDAMSGVAEMEGAIEQALIAGIEDDETRASAVLAARQKKRMDGLEAELAAKREAKKLDESVSLKGIMGEIALAQDLNDIEKDNLRNKFAARQKKEAEDAAKERAERLDGFSDDIARMEIDLGGGTDLEKTLAKLNIDKANALKAAGGDIAEVLKVAKLFNLKELAAKQGAANKAAEVAGGFGRRQLSGIGPKSSMSKQEQLAKDGNEKLAAQAKIVKDISNMLSKAPFIGGLVP